MRGPFLWRVAGYMLFDLGTLILAAILVFIIVASADRLVFRSVLPSRAYRAAFRVEWLIMAVLTGLMLANLVRSASVHLADDWGYLRHGDAYVADQSCVVERVRERTVLGVPVGVEVACEGGRRFVIPGRLPRKSRDAVLIVHVLPRSERVVGVSTAR